MRYKTVAEILDQAAALHQRVANLASQTSAAHDRQRLALVLDYLADHQAQLKVAIESFQSDADSNVLSTWFDRAPEIELPAFDGSDLAAADDSESLIEQVSIFHDRMIELYGNLRDQARIEQVQAVFGDLAELERHEKMELIQGTRQLQDI